MEVDASGFDRACDEWAAGTSAKIPGATLLAAEYLKGIAQEKTPVETGDLRGSAEARPGGDLGGSEVYYPGPYARYQHYGLDFHHEVGQALYLEMALIEGADKAIQIMRDTLHL